MLVNFPESTENTTLVKIQKFTGRKDASQRGAFSVCEKIKFVFTVSRRLAATGLYMVLDDDNAGNTENLCCIFDKTECGYDVYTCTVDLNKRYGGSDGLIFWKLCVVCGAKSLYTNSINNVDFELLQSQFDMENPTLLKNFLSSHLSGVIVMGYVEPSVIDCILEKGISIVGIDSSSDKIDNVRYNRYQAGCYAMQYLLNKGHRKIAYVGSNISPRNVWDLGRYEAYKKMRST